MAGDSRLRRAGGAQEPPYHSLWGGRRGGAGAWRAPGDSEGRRQAGTSPAARTTRQTRGGVLAGGAPDHRAPLRCPKPVGAGKEPARLTAAAGREQMLRLAGDPLCPCCGAGSRSSALRRLNVT